MRNCCRVFGGSTLYHARKDPKDEAINEVVEPQGTPCERLDLDCSFLVASQFLSFESLQRGLCCWKFIVVPDDITNFNARCPFGPL